MSSIVKNNSKRIFYFDALRALAILSVIIFHVSIRTKSLFIGDFSSFQVLIGLLGISLEFQ